MTASHPEKRATPAATEAKVADVQLVRKVAEGCIPSYEQLVSKYETRIYNMALRITRDTHDAEEVLQEVFITLFQKAHTFEGRCAFSSWLYRITFNASLMLLRKRKVRATVSLEEEVATVEFSHTGRNQTAAEYQRREVRAAIQHAVDRMPEHYRQVFTLRDIEGFSNEQAGDMLGMTIPAVKSKLHRARQILRRNLKRYWADYTGQNRMLTPRFSAVA